MQAVRALPTHLFFGAVALGFIACATASTTSDDDAGPLAVVEAGTHDAPSDLDAPPLVPDDTGVPERDGAGDDAASNEASVLDSSSGDGAVDASLDMNVPDTFDAGFCAAVPPSNLCGLTPQCGCGVGTCDVDRTVTTGDTVCTAAGTTARGQACTTTSQCTKGNTCESGACRPYCPTVGVNCTNFGTGKCVQVFSAPLAAIPNFKVCELDCALQNPTACGPAGSGVGCIYDGVNKATDCLSVGTSTTCSAASPICAPGKVCLDVGGAAAACHAWCRVGASGAADCAGAGGGTCSPFATAIVVKGQEYGACL